MSRRVKRKSHRSNFRIRVVGNTPNGGSKLISKAAAWRKVKARMARRLDMAQLAALREHGLV